MKIYTELHFRTQEPGIIIWPDSCWLLSNRPLYIPDFAPEFAAIPALAVKNSRLGKNVAPRFAPRYMAEWTAALILLPARAIRAMKRGMTPAASETCFDNALVIGDWQPGCVPADMHVKAFLPAPTTPVTTARGSSAPDSCHGAPDIRADYTAPPCMDEAARNLCNLSKTNTLKMGDMIMAPLSLDPIPLCERLCVEITRADTGCRLLFTRFH